MKRCFIFSAGTFYSLRERPGQGDLIIAADAGYRACLQAGLAPDLVVGDFDSMDQPEGLAGVLRAPVEKDDTDTMLAVKAGLARGCGRFFLYGCTGGARMDHTLANLQTLLWLRRQGGRGWMYGDGFVYTAIRNETLTIRKEVEWGLVSVFCFGDPARGVTETGMQYSLDDATLRFDEPLAVSNHMLEESAAVTVRDGTLLVGWQLPPLTQR